MVSSSLLSRSTLSSNCTDMLLRRTRSLSSHSSNNLYSVRFLSTNGGVTVQQFCSVMRESNRKASGLDRFTTIPQKHCEEPAKTNIKRGPRHKQHQVPRGGSTRMSSRREGKRFHGYLLRCFEQRPPTTEKTFRRGENGRNSDHLLFPEAIGPPVAALWKEASTRKREPVSAVRLQPSHISVHTSRAVGPTTTDFITTCQGCTHTTTQ